MAEISEPRTIQTIRNSPNRLAMVYSEGLSGKMYIHDHCSGVEVIDYIDALLEKIRTLESSI